MFEYFIKQSKIFLELNNKYKYLLEDRDRLEHSIKAIDNERIELGKVITQLQSAGASSIKEGNSSVIFEFDEELAVTVKSRINDKIVMKLIDKKYITPEFAEDEASIQFAFILMANEATEQIIEGINENEN